MNYEFFAGPSLNGWVNQDYFTDDRLFRSLIFQQQEFTDLDQFATWDSFDILFYQMRDNYLKHIERIIVGISDIEKSVIGTPDADDRNGIDIYKSNISYQRQLMSSLALTLSKISLPAHLLKHLEEIKVGLMQAWVIDIQLKTNTFELLAEKGRKFTSPSCRSVSALTKVIISIIEQYGDISEKETEKHLKALSLSEDETIQDVREGIIFWCDGSGRNKEFKISGLGAKLSNIKKKYFNFAVSGKP